LRLPWFVFFIAAILGVQACRHSPLDAAFSQRSGNIRLPAGVTELHRPLQLAPRAHDIAITGDPAGSVLHLAADFQGRAAIVGTGVTSVRVSGFRIAGARSTLASNQYLPPSDVAFADFYTKNGVLFTNSRGITIRNISFDRITAFPILISHCSDVEIQGVTIEDSGTLNAQGHSNTTGGILLEQGTTHFRVKDCRIDRICGNGIWTHANYGTPRNQDGVIEGNRIRGTPRDAIQAGHVERIQILGNSGGSIGVPAEQADLPGGATPVALDTAGDVSDSVYAGNDFEDVNGQCIDLDGFHAGQVLDNSCVNRGPAEKYPLSHVGIIFNNANPQMQAGNVLVRGNLIQGFGYGGVYLIGENQQIIGNRFIDVNRNHCTGDMHIARCNYAPGEPGMLRSGIYLASHGERPAQTRGNVIRDNFITGFGMDRWCVQAAPGVSLAANTIEHNSCAAK
jgi:hypothetical protein